MTTGVAQNRVHDRTALDTSTVSYGDDLRRLDAETGCARLRDRTEALYAREARRTGASIEAVRIALNYSADEIRRMVAAGL